MRSVPFNRSTRLFAAVLFLVAATSSSGYGQQRGGGPAAGQRGAAGARGGAANARTSAAIDMTGYWVSVVTEDWKYRMVLPPKGQYGGVSMTAEGRRLADAWDPSKDEAAGEQCRAYGAAGLMRMPTRLHITWEDDNVLKVESDAGMQTRLFRFGAAQLPPQGDPTWQGHSVAQWEAGGGARGAGARTGNLKVVTTRLRPGYVRRNGVPYSANTVLTEYYDLVKHPSGEQFLIVTTEVVDPQYLGNPFVTSSHFKKQADAANWDPQPCSAR
jgi:hypothetical protein